MVERSVRWYYHLDSNAFATEKPGRGELKNENEAQWRVMFGTFEKE